MNLLSHWRWPSLARRNFLRLAGVSALAQVTSARACPDQPPSPSPEIWTSPFAGKLIWGYADKHSVVPGESFALMLSSGPGREIVEGHAEFFRIGPRGPELLWASPPLAVGSQPVFMTAAAIGAAWPPAIEEVPTSGWTPGYCSIDFVHAKTGVREPQVAQIVIRNGNASGSVLLKLGANTYQAYNAWGGHSLYPSEDVEKRGAIVAFDRPTHPAFFEYDIYLLQWLEQLGAGHGFTVDCATDFDVHRDPALIEHYPLVISSCHDEYWTKEMFDAFEHRIFGIGRNVIFAGANTAYCQVRFADVNRPQDGEDNGRQLVCYKNFDDPIVRRKSSVEPALLVTSHFRDRERRPESMLAGVAYQNWFQPNGDEPRFPYRVASVDAPFFEGTGYKPGDIAAEVVGYEWDNRDPDGDGKRLWDKERSRIALLPEEQIQVLFRGEPVGADGAPGLAEAAYFRSATGAKVFSTGSIRWAWGLGKPGFEREDFKRFNANLVLDFLQ